MLDHLLSGGLAAAIAALISSFLVPLVAKLALVLEAVDRPGGRKTHHATVGRLGGLAILVGLVFGTGATMLMKWIEWNAPVQRQSLVALVLGTGMVFLVGLVDDVTGVSSFKKLIMQFVAAWLLVMTGWSFDVLGLPGGGELELGAASGVFTVLWIVGVTNAINLIDGLDGLATGVVAIIAGSFLVYAMTQKDPFSVVLMAGILGACLGFLPHNREPARIFMGDAGSLTLGFLLAATSIRTAIKAPAAVAILVPILALGVPVIDTVLVMGVRFLERPKGRLFGRFLQMFHADRNHLHHLLEDIVTHRRHAVRFIYVMVLASSGMALLVAMTKRGELGFILVAVEVTALVLVRRLGLARRARQLATAQKERLLRQEYSDERLQTNGESCFGKETTGGLK